MTTLAMTEMSMQSDASTAEQLDEFGTQETLEVFPNPAVSGTGDVTISGYQRMGGARETVVEVMRMTGEMMFTEKIVCQTGCDGFSVSVTKDLPPGVYLVNVVSNGERQTKRLLVK